MAERDRAPGGATEEVLLSVVGATLPAGRIDPPARLPGTLYRYIVAVSGRQQIVLCALTLLVLPLAMAPLELQRRIVDDAIAPGDLDLLLWLAAAYLGVALLTGALKFLRSLQQGRIGEGVIRALRRRLARESSNGDTGENEGSVVSIVSAEAEQVGAFVGESLGFPLLQGGTLVVVMGYMLVVDPLIALVAFAFFLPSLLLAPWIQARLNALVERRTVLLRELGDTIADDEKRDAGDDARGAIDGIYRLRMRIFALKYLAKFVNNLVGHLGPIAVLTFGGWMAIRGETQVGVLVAFISGYEKITDPARELLNFYRRAAQMAVQYRLVREALAAGRD